ncbi:MAG TPA: hypothetical protein VF701_07250 [Thermoanaerobaculia bacterium]
MRKATFTLVTLGLVTLVVVIARNAALETPGRAVRDEWPGGLGPLDSVEERYPARARTEAADELLRIAAAAGMSRETQRQGEADPVRDYVTAQMERDDRLIDPPSPELHAFLESHRETISTARRHLLEAEEIAWEVEIERGASAPVLDLIASMGLSRLLTASALVAARDGSAAAWNDLHAAWKVARSLWDHPELVSRLVALAISRQVTAASRQMPLPAPAWFDEVRYLDYRERMGSAMQVSTWQMWRSFEEQKQDSRLHGSWLTRIADILWRDPLGSVVIADSIEHQRETVRILMATRNCASDGATMVRERTDAAAWWNPTADMPMPNLIGAWQRLFRFRVELELAEHALGLRSGSASDCADAEWIAFDGGVRLSRDIPPSVPGHTAVPLVFRR